MMADSEVLARVVSAPGLDASERILLAKLIEQYQRVQQRNYLRTLYFDGERTLRQAGKLGMAMPPQLGKLETVLGWPSKAVEVLDNRLELQGFVVSGEADYDPGLDELFEANGLAVESSQAHVAALVHGVAFATVSAGNPSAGEPEVVVSIRSAREASGLWSARQHRLIAGLTINRGVAGVESDQVVLWLDDRVVTIDLLDSGAKVDRQPHGLGRTPMVMLPYRPHLEKRYGVSRITRPLMALTDAAARTVLRMEGTAEFFSFPQRWAVGVEREDFDGDTFKTYLNRILALSADSEGRNPQVGTFSAASPEPHIAQLRAIAMLVAGESSIPPNFLGIIQDNPSSAEAILAAEADLVKVAERAQGVFGAAWCEVIRLAQVARDGGVDDRLEGLRALWRDPATPTRAAQADAVVKLVSSGVLPKESAVTWEQLGYDPVTVSRLRADAVRGSESSRLRGLTRLVDDGAGDVVDTSSGRVDPVTGL